MTPTTRLVRERTRRSRRLSGVLASMTARLYDRLRISVRTIAGISVLPVVLLGLSLMTARTEAAASPHAESATCRPASPELSTYATGLNRARLEPAFDAVTLTRQGDGLRVAWSLSAPLKSSENLAEYASAIFNVTIFKKSASTASGALPFSDILTALQIQETHDSPHKIEWAAAVGGLGSSKVVRNDPVTLGRESVVAYFPFSSLKKPSVPRSFKWTAVDLSLPGPALEGCPTPENGYGHGGLGIDLQWTKAELQTFP